MLSGVLDQDGRQLSASQTRLQALADADHLAILHAIWTDQTTQAREQHYRDLLAAHLPPEHRRELGHQARWLWRTLRTAELVGLDPVTASANLAQIGLVAFAGFSAFVGLSGSTHVLIVARCSSTSSGARSFSLPSEPSEQPGDGEGRDADDQRHAVVARQFIQGQRVGYPRTWPAGEACPHPVSQPVTAEVTSTIVSTIAVTAVRSV